MNYQIIIDETKFREFIEWLPDLQPHEMIYCALFARGKYNPAFNSSKSDSQQLARFVTTKDKIFDRIKQLECEIGSYHKNGLEVPQEVLALYINPSPRCMKKASIKLTHECIKLLAGEHSNYNLTQLALTCAHRAKGKNQKVGFDFDYPELDLENFKSFIIKCVNPEALTLVKTRGGVHAFVDAKLVHKEFEKSWYKDISNGLKFGGLLSDRTGDFETPAWGCTQGMFVPYKIEL